MNKERFLELKTKPNQTAYKTAFNCFEKFFGIKLDTYIEKTDIKEIEEDLFKFAKYLKETKSPNTRGGYFGRIHKFLERNDINIKSSVLETIKEFFGKRTVIFEDKVPTKEELKAILSFGNITSKALFFTLLSSGMRQGELLQIPLNDVHLDESPTRIHIRGEYAKNSLRRDTFISDETKEYLENWLLFRKRYLIQSAKRQNLPNMPKKSLNDNRLFPMSKNNALVMWNILLKKAGLDEKDAVTGKALRHIHTLRKYFRSKMGSVIQVDIVEALIGHSGYLTKAYRRYERDELADFYKQGESSVCLYATSLHDAERINSLEKESEYRKEDADELREEIRKLKGEKKELITNGEFKDDTIDDISDRDFWKEKQLQEERKLRNQQLELTVKITLLQTEKKPDTKKINKLVKEVMDINKKLEELEAEEF